MKPNFRIREIDANNPTEIAIVATRMRQTLIEIVGKDEGAKMYSMDWLVDRVRQHLDPTRLTGAVFLAVLESGEIAGHTIVRVEKDDEDEFGLLSTFFVNPVSRGMGIGQSFVEAGESWMENRGLSRSATYTAEDNLGLHRQMNRNRHKIELRNDKMVAFVKRI